MSQITDVMATLSLRHICHCSCQEDEQSSQHMTLKRSGKSQELGFTRPRDSSGPPFLLIDIMKTPNSISKKDHNPHSQQDRAPRGFGVCFLHLPRFGYFDIGLSRSSRYGPNILLE